MKAERPSPHRATLLQNITAALRECADKIETATAAGATDEQLANLGAQLLDAAAMVAHANELGRETFVGLARGSCIQTRARARARAHQPN